MRITKVAYLGRTTLGEETVIKTEKLEQRRQGPELAPDAGGARLRSLELVAPGDDVGASDAAHLDRPPQASECRELLDIAL
jgi:hypothetical protein